MQQLLPLLRVGAVVGGALQWGSGEAWDEVVKEGAAGELLLRAQRSISEFTMTFSGCRFRRPRMAPSCFWTLRSMVRSKSYLAGPSLETI